MGFGKDGKGVIIREEVTITPGALVSKTVIKGTGGAVLQTTSFRILKTEYFIVQNNAWATNGDGIIVGLANGALTTVQIADCIDANGPDDRNDTVTADESMRAVWLLNLMKEPFDAGGVADASRQVNNGLPISFNPKWTFTPTEGWDWFAYNPFTGNLTSGASFIIIAKHFGVWVD